MKLLPPLVTAQDVRVFLTESLRAPILDTRIVKAISRARNDQLAKKLMTLQTKRVKVTDARMYVFTILERGFVSRASLDVRSVINV